MFVYYFVRLLQEAGSDIPIESFILVIASAQWIVGPVLAYAGLEPSLQDVHVRSGTEYMALAVPGVCFIRLVCTAFRSSQSVALIRPLCRH